MSYFLAIDPDQTARNEVARLVESLQMVVPAAKWLPQEKLHVTLVFLGDLLSSQLDAIRGPSEEIVSTFSPFSLRLRGAGRFETARAPEVLWLGVDGEVDHLRALRKPLSELLTKDREPHYVPHLTLARSARGNALGPLLPQLQPFESSAFFVDRVTLYESAQGRYREVFGMRFKG